MIAAIAQKNKCLNDALMKKGLRHNDKSMWAVIDGLNDALMKKGLRPINGFVFISVHSLNDALMKKGLKRLHE